MFLGTSSPANSRKALKLTISPLPPLQSSVNPYRTCMPGSLNYEKIKKDMDDWPNRWAGDKSDLSIGGEIVQTMHKFLLAMMEEGQASITIKRHLDNLWLLGGEIIYQIHDERKLKKASGKELIMRFVDEEGGPLSRHLSTEEEQKLFDGTCRKFYRFLKKASKDE
jgi:hypothetical protein